MNTIAATTTRTGLKVRADLDPGTCDTGMQVSDAHMDALPLDRHDWHGDWNYTLRPREHGQPPSDPDPFDQPSPALAWLCRPALTGMPAAGWDALVTTLMTLHDHQREASLDKRRGHRPRQAAPGPGRRPALTLAGRLLAAILHYRHALPQVAIATLFCVRPRRSASASATSASSSTRQAPRSSQARNASPPCKISTTWQDRQTLITWVKIKSACYFPASP